MSALPLLALSDLDRGPGAALLEATVAQGFSEPVARAGLRAELDAWSPDGIKAVLSELPPDLDPARRPGTVLIFAARTLPASAMRAVLMARLLGARVLLKPASGQAALGHAIAAADPEVEARPFRSEDLDAVEAAIDAADTVVVLGGAAAVAELRARVPSHKGFCAYGHRVSVAWADHIDAARALAVARDVCAWDQAGCLSPQVLMVQTDFMGAAQRVADALREVEAELPMTLPDDARSGRYAAQAFSEMTGACFQTETALVAALPTPGFRPAPAPRTLWVQPAHPTALSHIASVLSTVGYAGPEGGCPAPASVRVCALGQMQRPPLTWLHDGRENLPPLLRPA